MKWFLNTLVKLAGIGNLPDFGQIFLSGCKLLKNIDKRGFRFE
jgi:hypothetical protein